jgi:hypothetical protein
MEKAGGIATENIYGMFSLPLSTIAHEKLSSLQEELESINFNSDNDEWSFSYGNKFPTKKLHRALIGEHVIMNPC